MYVQVVTVDAKKKTVLNVSKLTKVADLKRDIAEEFDIEPAKQALFFRGKHLEDDATLHDYGINLNNVIQVMIKSDQADSPKGKDVKEDKVETPKKEEEVDAESEYYKVGDSIDCTDNALGAWYEAVITKIFTKNEKLIYKVRWDLPDTKNDDPFDVEEDNIRPRAWKTVNFNDLDIGQKVMVNYNLEEPKETGNWYDFTIVKIKNTQNLKELTGTIHIGRDNNNVENCVVNNKLEIYQVEKPVLLSERDDALVASRILKTRRKVPFKCNTCQDHPKKKCKECSCRVCGEKKNPHLTLLCDECDEAYHIGCLKPPLSELPEDDDWYCPNCKVNANEIVKVGQKNKTTKKTSSKTVGTTRDWGKGMACVGRTKICTLVPLDHKGHIPGIEVGTMWKFRFQVSEAGVHRPHVAGIHGRADECAYSIVLSGGYEDDVDNGEEFFYTGSGGRDLSGNKRTAKQSCDQRLTLMNKALALNCSASLNEKGAVAEDWKKGIPIRVVRNYKLAKHSKYAPEDGNRYDGLYKVIKYWPEKGQSGFKVWRYLLRRDDPIPAPWTKEGKARMRELGLKMFYPEGYQEAQMKKNKENQEENQTDNQPEIKKRKSEFAPDKTESPVKKRKNSFKLSTEISKLIAKDSVNSKLWKQCKELITDGKQAYYDKVSTEFVCIVCQDLVYKPITTPCAHNICMICLKRSFKANTYVCPMCRTPLDKNYEMEINETLQSILLLMFPGYDKTR